MSEWKQAGWNPLRVFVRNGTAITVGGTNRYTGQPVNVYGLTKEADALRRAILAQFPGSPTKQNFAVDRAIRGGTALSDHARGEALDFMIAGFDGDKASISVADKLYGRDVMDWVVARAKGQPLGRGLRDKEYRGPDRLGYILFDGLIYYAIEDRVRPLKPTSNQHRDHVHMSIVPVDRSLNAEQGPPVPAPAPTKPVLGRGSKGPKVELWQKRIAPVVDGRFGPQTEAHLKVWQAERGLPVTGIIDADDWAEL